MSTLFQQQQHYNFLHVSVSRKISIILKLYFHLLQKFRSATGPAESEHSIKNKLSSVHCTVNSAPPVPNGKAIEHNLSQTSGQSAVSVTSATDDYGQPANYP